MPSYCLELYLPQASAARLEEASSQARLAAEAFATNGLPVRYVRTTYLAEDDTCFHLFEASSAEDVAEAARRAGLPSGRITLAVEAAAAPRAKRVMKDRDDAGEPRRPVGRHLPRRRNMKRSTLAATVLAVLATLTAYGTAALADPSPSTLPPNWHIHDGLTGLGPEHKGIGFFPAILGVSTATYLADPASCPDATDKAFLPQGRQEGQPLRAGMCRTSSKIIHLKTVPVGAAGPEGWSSITSASEPGWVTYYLVTDR